MQRPLGSYAQVLAPVATVVAVVIGRSENVSWPVIALILIGGSLVVIWAAWDAYQARRPLVVDLQGDSVEQEDAMQGGGYMSTRRIRVYNPGRAQSGVLVRLEASEPQRAPFYPLYFERMHYEEQPFTLAHKQSEYIDVVRTIPGNPELLLTYDRKRHPSIPNGMPVPRLKLFIAVVTDSNTATHRFFAYRNANGRLCLEHADPPNT